MKYEDDLNQMFSEFHSRVEDYAEQVFNKVILPYCKKWHLDYLTGNGVMVFFPTENTPESFIKDKVYRDGGGIWEHKLPKRIHDAVYAEIPSYTIYGVENLGYFMPNYRDGKQEK